MQQVFFVPSVCVPSHALSALVYKRQQRLHYITCICMFLVCILCAVVCVWVLFTCCSFASLVWWLHLLCNRNRLKDCPKKITHILSRKGGGDCSSVCLQEWMNCCYVAHKNFHTGGHDQSCNITCAVKYDKGWNWKSGLERGPGPGQVSVDTAHGQGIHTVHNLWTLG